MDAAGGGVISARSATGETRGKVATCMEDLTAVAEGMVLAGMFLVLVAAWRGWWG